MRQLKTISVTIFVPTRLEATLAPAGRGTDEMVFLLAQVLRSVLVYVKTKI